MKTIEIQLFKFAELSSEAQQNAIQKERKYMYETGTVLHFFYEHCYDRISERGFKNPTIEYSLSYSQGDGPSFIAENYVFLNDLVLEVFGAHHPRISAFIVDNLILTIKGNNGRYCFASRSDINIELGFYGNNECELVNDVISEIQSRLTGIYLGVCKKLENDGYAEIEYQQSDEAITETLQANDYDFTANGEIH